MSAVTSIASAIERLAAMAQAASGAEGEAMTRACGLVCDEARGIIGHEAGPEGPFPSWPPLAAVTEKDRERDGFTPDAPLLRDGSLRDSIGIAVTTGGGDTEGAVGSDSPIAIFQELGTSRIPPRSFLGAAAVRTAEAAAAELAHGIVAALFAAARHSTGHDR